MCSLTCSLFTSFTHNLSEIIKINPSARKVVSGSDSSWQCNDLVLTKLDFETFIKNKKTIYVTQINLFISQLIYCSLNLTRHCWMHLDEQQPMCRLMYSTISENICYIVFIILYILLYTLQTHTHIELRSTSRLKGGVINSSL